MVIGYWLLVIGYWLLVTGYWLGFCLGFQKKPPWFFSLVSLRFQLWLKNEKIVLTSF